MSHQTILMGHGSGGSMTHDLISNIFLKHFRNSHLEQLSDASIIKTSNQTAFTTDSYVIDPLFFPGGDIGKLAISGTVNDLLVAGALPRYLSAGFIIEEGLPLEVLDNIAASMAKEAKKAGVTIITGDTKVVNRGQCDKVFINTAGIGDVLPYANHLGKKAILNEKDKVIVSGFLGDHAATILGIRNNISFENELKSDVAPLNALILPVLDEYGDSVKFMRDITRGGLATILNEICQDEDFGFQLFEENIPVRPTVRGLCEVFGYDPLYLANEGKIVLIADEKAADAILDKMKSTIPGENASIVGEISSLNKKRVTIKSAIGGNRIVDMLTGEMLPRIC